MAEEVRSTLQKRDTRGQVRHGGEWLAIWADPDSLKSDADRRAETAARGRAEALRARILASARSLAGDPDLEISFAPITGQAAGLLLRSGPADGNGDLRGAELAALRGAADAQAAFRRFHDPALHAALRPQDPDEARLFDLIEHARCEGRAARAYPGLVANLTAHHHARLARAQLLNAHLASLLPLAEALRMLLRDSYANLAEPSIQTAGFRMWDGWLRARFADRIAGLADTLADQATHAGAARAFLAALFAELASRGRVERKLTPSAPDDSPGDDGRALREAEDPARASLFDPGDEVGLAPDHATAATASAGSTPPAPYRPFTTRHDRVVAAADLFDRSALRRSRQHLDAKRADDRREVARLAARLQRRLLAEQDRQWHFDLEEGLVDASRLDRVVMSPGFAAAYKQETDSPFRDTLVTLLIDSSGSMRGKPIEIACVTADIVAAALERCAIATEILGFTTSAWKGGLSAKDWRAAGKPPEPGRLNDLLHIVFKDADTPLRRARDDLSAMLSPSLLKENIDGEALAWAVARMQRRPEARKLLIVISDGAPVDQATLEANGDKDLLDRHLRATIDTVFRTTDVAVAALGLKHDVARYYENSVRIEAPEQLAESLLELIDRSVRA